MIVAGQCKELLDAEVIEMSKRPMGSTGSPSVEERWNVEILLGLQTAE